MSFEGKVVAITGAAMGIGYAAALAFARQGARVTIVDIDPTSGATALEQAGDLKVNLAFFPCDVSSESQARSTVQAILERWGRLDVWVNNAGIYVQADLIDARPVDWERILAVNLTGAFLCSKYAAEAMVEHGGGVIVNVASEAGLIGIPGQVAYNVSKAGMIMLTKSCAVDLASRGIRVNCVCPGTTDTPLVKAAIQRAPDPAEARRKLESVRPLNRLGKVEEIAAAVLFMASEEAGYATGSVLSIDGGNTAK
jgi:NAD(P)-dependent dehydrogenase (short-subunit alcohol dehydrogenase family)